MAIRYKKIVWDSIKGTGQEIFDILKPNFLNTTQNIALNPGTKRIEENLSVGHGHIATREISPLFRNISENYPYSTLNSKLFVLSYDTANTKVVKEVLTAGAISLNTKYDFDAGSSEPAMIVIFKTYLLAFYHTHPTYQVSISGDNGVTWTDYAFGYPLPIGHKIIGDRLYIWNDNEILYTTDGANYTAFYEADVDDLYIYGVDELDGEIYAIVGYNGYAKIIKFDSNNRPKILRDFKFTLAPKMRVFNNKIVIITKIPGDTYTRIYTYDGNDFILQNRTYIASNANIAILAQSPEFLYVYLQASIYRLDQNFQPFHFHTLTKSLADLNFMDSSINVIETDSVNHELIIYQYGGTTNDVATKTTVFTTPQIAERHIPAHIIIKHDPLPTPATITIKAKSNREATFATTILTNSTNASVEANAALKNLLDQVDFIEFEITITNDNDTTDIVKNLQLIYLYTPAGMEKET